MAQLYLRKKRRDIEFCYKFSTLLRSYVDLDHLSKKALRSIYTICRVKKRLLKVYLLKKIKKI